MTRENDPLATALNALETALGAFGPAESIKEQKLDEIDPLAAPARPDPAVSIAGVEAALETPIEVLREKLGNL